MHARVKAWEHTQQGTVTLTGATQNMSWWFALPRPGRFVFLCLLSPLLHTSHPLTHPLTDWHWCSWLRPSGR